MHASSTNSSPQQLFVLAPHSHALHNYSTAVGSCNELFDVSLKAAATICDCGAVALSSFVASANDSFSVTQMNPHTTGSLSGAESYCDTRIGKIFDCNNNV